MDAALVDILGGIGTLLLLALFFRKFWQPANDLALQRRGRRAPEERGTRADPRARSS